MGCNQRLTIASELNQLGLIDRVPYGPSFYRINQNGLKALRKAGRPEVMEVEQALKKVDQRLIDLKAICITLKSLADNFAKYDHG